MQNESNVDINVIESYQESLASYTDSVSEQNFSKLLASITTRSKNIREDINQAFHAALRNLLHSHDTSRLNALRATLSKTEHWTKVRAAIFAFSGGYELDRKALKRFRAPELSPVYTDKEGIFRIREDYSTLLWLSALARYEDVKTYKYDELRLDRPASPGLDLTALTKTAQHLAANWDKRNPKYEEMMAVALCALSDAIAIELPAGAILLNERYRARQAKQRDKQAA